MLQSKIPGNLLDLKLFLLSFHYVRVGRERVREKRERPIDGYSKCVGRLQNVKVSSVRIITECESIRHGHRSITNFQRRKW